MTVVKTLLIGIVGLFVGFNGFRQYEASQLVQPYSFNHAAHRVMACVRCHEGAVEGVMATLPPLSTCLKCHSSSPLADQSALTAWAKAVSDRGFQWKKLTSVPDYVYFSHRRHTKMGKIDCKKCHSDMQDLTGPPPLPLIRIQMSLCTDCHSEREVSDDCTRCHK